MHQNNKFHVPLGIFAFPLAMDDWEAAVIVSMYKSNTGSILTSILRFLSFAFFCFAIYTISLVAADIIVVVVWVTVAGWRQTLCLYHLIICIAPTINFCWRTWTKPLLQERNNCYLLILLISTSVLQLILLLWRTVFDLAFTFTTSFHHCLIKVMRKWDTIYQ